MNENWHMLQTPEVARILNVHPETGLRPDESQARLTRFGPNRITRKRRDSPLKRFLLQFHQALVYILLAATGVSLFLAEWAESAVIFGVVLVNAIVGYLQESKAQRAIEALAEMVLTEATVRRDGRIQRIPAEQLVPGDVVLLQSGDRVPADLRLTLVRNLQVDESPLTGESVPVQKLETSLPAETTLADRKNMAYAGTSVTYGQAEGLVCATGDTTETGRIAHLISEATEIVTPLTKKIASFSRLLLYVILVLATLTFTVGVLRGEKASEMFMAAIALAVGAIPEGLPAAVTIVLAIGVARMAKRRVIIRSLPAVETLGSTTVICSDKTGTLTENQMTVREIYTNGILYDVSGNGYAPEGSITRQGKPVQLATQKALHECLKCGLLCSDSQVVQEDSRWKVQGDPTEAALIASALKGGLEERQLGQDCPRLDTIPFESQHQYMATLHANKAGVEPVIYVKGATERLLERCTTTLMDDGTTVPLNKTDVLTAADRMAAKGLRVLAFATSTAASGQGKFTPESAIINLTFLGLQGMLDPPRAEAIDAVRRCQAAGISVKMITGDHVRTAEAIAGQLGLQARSGTGVIALNGAELAALTDQQLVATAENGNVFARVAPEQKLRLVNALQSRGHVVAMTGDGVNDAPALKQADIGIAMGITGTDVAKGAADMLLTDDNFASIEAAVEEGRSVFDNLTKFIVWTLPTNGGEALVVLAAIIAGATLPLLPVHLLWINMTTAVLLGTTLVFEPKEKDLMNRPPRDPGESLLTLPLLWRTALVSVLMLFASYGLFLFEMARTADLAVARTVAANTIVMAEVIYLFNCRTLKRSMISVGLFSNHWIFWGIGCMLAAQAAFTYVPFMNAIFATKAITFGAWARIVAATAVIFVVVEIEKSFRNKPRS